MNKFIGFLLCALFVFGAAACGGNSDFENLSEGEYVLYYTDAKASSITKYVYETKETDTINLVKELVESMKNVNSEGAVSVMPEKMTYNHVDFNDGILYVYFSGGTGSFTNASKLVFVSSITRALSQIKEINGVQIYDDEGIMRDSNGKAYEVLKPEMFITSDGK